ncbi:hypothetical protein RRG08_000477 [Elysia crispata]|uniref:Uncharacterized protein n=1 Tax=Elysia crispata TaxID=231223 RepID=A0AAE0YCZ3_9GAST|nr:hypothetical protein RRG08_000477 [Elysia crispata]
MPFVNAARHDTPTFIAVIAYSALASSMCDVTQLDWSVSEMTTTIENSKRLTHKTGNQGKGKSRKVICTQCRQVLRNLHVKFDPRYDSSLQTRQYCVIVDLVGLTFGGSFLHHRCVKWWRRWWNGMFVK